MTQNAPTRDRPRRAAIVAALLVALTMAAPAAIAQNSTAGGSNDDVFGLNTLPDCSGEGAGCIVTAILSSIAGFFLAVGVSVASIITSVGNGIAVRVILPFLGIFAGFFTGLGEGLGALGRDAFAGGGEAFRGSYQTLTSSLEVFGIAAPLVAAVVVLGVIALILLAVRWALAGAVNLLPEPLEKVLGDESDED